MRRKDSGPASLWLHGLVRESLTVLCRNALTYDRHIHIEGLLCISIDDESVVVVNVNELLSKHVSILQFSVTSPFNLKRIIDDSIVNKYYTHFFVCRV